MAQQQQTPLIIVAGKGTPIVVWREVHPEAVVYDYKEFETEDEAMDFLSSQAAKGLKCFLTGMKGLLRSFLEGNTIEEEFEQLEVGLCPHCGSVIDN